MARPTSVVNLDPIDRKKNLGVIGRLMITRPKGGRKVFKSEPFGHYMFCGPQGSGKSASVLWYAEELIKKYKRKRLKYLVHDKCDHDQLIYKCKQKKFKEPPKVILYSNFGVGRGVIRDTIAPNILGFDPYANEVRILIVDEIHTYFPREHADKESKAIQKVLINLFSQLRKRNTFILSTAQVYGRLEKSLREQCLFMINCKVNYRSRIVNDFIPGDDIISDDLGRWAGRPKWIYTHGLSNLNYDTKKVIID